MKFIFPQNYNFKNKLFGIIDYSSLIFNIVFDAFIFGITHLLGFSISTKVVITVTLGLPVLLFSIAGFNHENILYIILYLWQYFKKPKLYLYNK